MDELYNWENIAETGIVKRLLSDWEDLLDNDKLKEHTYHDFLFSTPAFFLTLIESYLVISKFKLGADYETDFVVVKEGYSDGTIYEFIEIESPHIELFDIKGKPSSKFNSALQQIRDWKRFLKKNKDFFSKYLPTTSTRVIKDSRIVFKIIIGRRSDDAEVMEKRRQIAEDENIEIVSFDRLTDTLKFKSRFSNKLSIYAAQMADVDQLKINQLANPFYECITDSIWRTICKKGHTNHFYYNFLDELLKHRTYNKYFDDFKSSYT
jgi:hypothetical protein